MKHLYLLLLCGIICHAQQTTNFFITPGSQADQLASGNHSADYPLYQEGDSTLFAWTTNWTVISLLLYQNENASYIRLMDFVQDPPNSITYNMSPPVDLSWNNVFFLTLWNENWATEGGEQFFSSSYFRINASSTTTPSPTPTPSLISTTTAAGTTITTTTTTTAITTASIMPTSQNDSSSGGLSPDAKIGLGIGIGLGIPFLALCGVVLFYLRRANVSTPLLPLPSTTAIPPPYQPPPVSDLGNPSPFKLGAPEMYSPPIEAEGSTSARSTATTTLSGTPIQELSGDRSVYH